MRRVLVNKLELDVAYTRIMALRAALADASVELDECGSQVAASDAHQAAVRDTEMAGPGWVSAPSGDDGIGSGSSTGLALDRAGVDISGGPPEPSASDSAESSAVAAAARPERADRLEGALRLVMRSRTWKEAHDVAAKALGLWSEA